ncbi:hypothetical protein ABZP36_025285 [Zizania latifolia]
MKQADSCGRASVAPRAAPTERRASMGLQERTGEWLDWGKEGELEAEALGQDEKYFRVVGSKLRHYPKAPEPLAWDKIADRLDHCGRQLDLGGGQQEREEPSLRPDLKQVRAGLGILADSWPDLEKMGPTAWGLQKHQ